MLISQDRNNIFEVFQSPELTTHHVFQSLKPTTQHVQVTCTLGTLQCGILHSPGLHKNPTFC